MRAYPGEGKVAYPGEGKVSLNAHSSFRKRMRAARRGTFTPTAPTEQAKLRHAWYRREVRVRELRTLLGQDMDAHA